MIKNLRGKAEQSVISGIKDKQCGLRGIKYTNYSCIKTKKAASILKQLL
jgi:hypothetical protein